MNVRLRRRLGRWCVLGVVLALVGLIVPDSAPKPTTALLVKVEHADGVDTSPGVTWILALGSDARPGQSATRSRGDAIKIVGLNPHTGHATIIGLPRDSFVDIPGHGRNKLNSAMVFGGPQLMASTVQNISGIRLDYVFATTFQGFQRMVAAVGGVNVYSRFTTSETLNWRSAHFRRGMNHLDGVEAVVFARQRYGLPGGDFDRSANQARLLVAGLRRARQLSQSPGQLERILASLAQNTFADIGPAELYRLARAALEVDAGKVRSCTIGGSTGTVGGASVVFADLGQLRRIGADAEADGRANRGC